MKQIVVEKPSEQVNISNSTIYTHTFKGVNNGDTVKLRSKSMGCSCTSLDVPLIIYNGEFEITMKVDKIGRKGLYSVTSEVEFDNGEKIILHLNGMVYDQV